MNYVRDVSICEQCILQLYQNTYFFTSLIMNQKYVATLICRIFGSNLDIIVIIMCYFGDKILNCL